ncbi:MAG: hypothetical protein LBL51_00375 [Synergistaceae bacterium]|jgi:hypothetical protein|nr:hypothetical protein [Synergistaceae bacterium]
MTPSELVEGIAEFLEERLKDGVYPQKGSGGALKPLRVFRHAIPQVEAAAMTPLGSESDDDMELEEIEDLFPCAVVRLDEGTDSIDGGNAAVRIVVGVFDNRMDSQGDRDVLSILHRIRQSLLEKPLIMNTFRLMRPMKWRLYEENSWPIYFGDVETTWLIPSPQEVFDFETGYTE